MPAVATDLAISLDRASPLPLPAQLAAGLRRAIAAGTLAVGDRAPSTRQLAARCRVSRGTVQVAYDQLVAEGYLVARERSGMRVAAGVVPTGPTPRPARLPPAPPSPRIDLVPGHDRTSPLTDAAWRSAWSRAVREDHTGAVDPLGISALREAIAEQLRLVRGLVVDPNRLLVTAGTRDGLTLVVRALAVKHGRRPRLALASPDAGLGRALARLAVDVVSVPDVTDLSGFDAVLVAPNHTVATRANLNVDPMPARARSALLREAERARAIVIEDDYDGEYRYLTPPLPALVESAPQQVAHLATFSALLTRDVGTGYVILPETLHALAEQIRADLGCPVAPLIQRAVAHYLASGGARRHIARSRRELLAAQILVAGLRPPRSVDTGHLLLLDLSAAATARVRGELANRGIAVGALRPGVADADAAPAGLVFDYAGVPPDDLRETLNVVRALLA